MRKGKLTPAVRTTRARIIHLRNDWKDLMALVEKRLHEHFASLQDTDAESASPANVDAALPRDSIPETPDQPFARVNTVVENSPAAAAGLKPGDLIRNFGYVNLENHDDLKKVAECVQGNEGVWRPQLFLILQPSCSRADHLAAKHPRQGLAQQRGLPGPGTAPDINAAAGLGRQGVAWMPHSAIVMLSSRAVKEAEVM